MLDALNGIAYSDDKQLLNIYASKFYGAKPMLMVQFAEWGGAKMATGEDAEE